MTSTKVTADFASLLRFRWHWITEKSWEKKSCPAIPEKRSGDSFSFLSCRWIKRPLLMSWLSGFKKDWNVEFRAYDDGIAYRFVSRSKKPFNVVDETVDYHFPSDMVASVPYVKKQEKTVIMTLNISIPSKILILPIHYRSWIKKRLMFLPLVGCRRRR